MPFLSNYARESSHARQVSSVSFFLLLMLSLYWANESTITPKNMPRKKRLIEMKNIKSKKKRSQNLSLFKSDSNLSWSAIPPPERRPVLMTLKRHRK